MTADPFDVVSDKLGGLHNGMAACPAHEDRAPSLSVTRGDDGQVLLHCHAGCPVDQITAAIGLKTADLFPSRPSTNGHKRIVATYDYVDEHGEVLYQAVRYEPKAFKQRRPNGRGGWEWKLTGTRRVLFRLPRVLAAVAAGETVYVAEGEKDVEALERAGVTATTNAQGAGKWLTVRDAGAVLAGATVIVVADRDEAGRRHAADVAANLRGLRCHVTVVEPPAPHKDVSEMLGVGLELDALLPSEVDGNVTSTSSPPQWSGEPGCGVLDDVHAALTHYIALSPPEATDAVALWIAATHAQPVWEHATRLVIKSPVKRCGKTRLQEVAGELVYRPLRTSNISAAALARSIDAEDPPTIMLDEADSIFAKRRGERSEGAEDLRGIINAGHGRGFPYIRWNMNLNRGEECATFAMAIIGGIGDMPDTIEDRAVIISMRRRAPGEQVAQFRRRRALPPLHALRTQIAGWVRHHLEVLADAEPELPVEDRAADVWEPLVAIADLAGGDWPQRARAACRVLTGDSDPDDGTAGERLLADLAAVFADDDKLPTATITERLVAIEEAPWGDWYGKPLNARGLAKLLKPYAVRSRNVRTGDGQAKGYWRDDLADAWARYLHGQPSQPSQRPNTPETPGEAWDGNGTATDSTIRPTPDLHEHTLWDAGTDGTQDSANGAPLTDDTDVWRRGANECTDCLAPTTDISGLCTDCIGKRALT